MSLSILVCGGRNYLNPDKIYRVLDAFNKRYGIKQVVHGAAEGADSLGGAWAESRNIERIPCPADWKKNGKAAGPIRNQYMVDTYHIDRVLAFGGSRGTKDMIEKARQKGVKILIFD